MNRIKSPFLPVSSSLWWTSLSKLLAKCLIFLACALLFFMPPVYASINDDRYDGNIFVLYAGNGSLVPARGTLAQSLQTNKPAVLFFYVDDSSDCKEYAIVVSTVQASYGREVEIIPVDVDAIPVKEKYEPTEPGYYYSGGVPQVVAFNKSGQVILNKKGQVPYEEIDDKFREVFDLLPRSESKEFKRRSFNEFNTQLTQ